MTKESKEIRAMTAAAAAAAIAAALVLLRFVSPLFEALAIVTSGISIAVVGTWYGAKKSIPAGIAAVLLVTLTTGVRYGLTAGVYAAVMGAAVGACLRARLPFPRANFFTGAAYALYTAYDWTMSIFVLGAEEGMHVMLEKFAEILYLILPPLEAADLSVGGFPLSGLVTGSLFFFLCGGWAIGRLNLVLADIVLKRLALAGWKRNHD